jgi:protein-tyrosine phosphatase
VDLAGIRARQVAVEDFSRFDYVLAMDRDNLRHLKSLSPPEYVERIHLFLDFMPEGSVKDVPDPYYGGNLGFERVLDLIEEAVEGLLVELRRRSARRP